MPFYECFAPAGALNDDQKARVAKEITRIHCSATGAPESFVNVFFHAYQPGDFFTAGQRSTACRIRGSIRAGRSAEVRAEMLRDLSTMWVRTTGLPEEKLTVQLAEIPASNSFKGGRVTPEPGQEADWLLAGTRPG